MAEPGRAADRAHFLAAHGLDKAACAPLAGDASARRYLRLAPASGRSLILMDAPPAANGPLAAFVHAGEIFTAAGLSVPRIHAVDSACGFLLQEDLGDTLLPNVIASDPSMEPTLYAEVIRAILTLQRAASPAGLPHHDPATRAALALPAYQVYGEAAGASITSATEAAFLAELGTVLARHAPEADVVIHRDCHAENLVWLPDRAGVARVGWLDFQDAEAGHPAYDPVSLLKDARRDLSLGLEEEMIRLFLAESGQDRATFAAAYAALGAQRNLRILGLFTRLCRDRGRPAYLALLPRVWRHLAASLEHPALAGLRARVLEDLPPPDTATLRRLRQMCPTAPTP